MATYLELADLQFSGRLKDQTRIAVMVAAQTIEEEPPQTPNHQERLGWAAWTLRNVETSARQMVPAVLALKKDLPAEEIIALTDAQVQADVDANVDLFATTMT